MSKQEEDRMNQQDEIDLELHPEYNVTTLVDGQLVGEMQKVIDDPFATTRVDIGWKDVLKAAWPALRHRKGIRVVVEIGGNWDAIKHVLTPRPVKAVMPLGEPPAAVAAAFSDSGPTERELRETRNQPHTLWWWEDPIGPIPVPYASSHDTADQAEAAAREIVGKMGARPNLRWVRVFRSDNESFETYRWENPLPPPPSEV